MTRYGHLHEELRAIASDELADELAAWLNWTDEQEAKLARYLREELATHGMLSVEKGREAEQAMGDIRRDARRLLAKIGAA